MGLCVALAGQESRGLGAEGAIRAPRPIPGAQSRSLVLSPYVLGETWRDGASARASAWGGRGGASGAGGSEAQSEDQHQAAGEGHGRNDRRRAADEREQECPPCAPIGAGPVSGDSADDRDRHVAQARHERGGAQDRNRGGPAGQLVDQESGRTDGRDGEDDERGRRPLEALGKRESRPRSLNRFGVLGLLIGERLIGERLVDQRVVGEARGAAAGVGGAGGASQSSGAG